MIIKNRNYIIFSIAITILTLLGTFIVVYFGLTSPDSVNGFPEYKFSEYIDHSQDKKVLLNDGAQLYEAESFSLNYQASLMESISASQHMAVFVEGEGASVVCSFESDQNMNVKLTLSLSYISNNRKDANAKEILQVMLNSEPISLNGVDIHSSYNILEFIENDICVLPLRKGKNTLELISSKYNEFSLDYLVLTTLAQKRIDRSLETTRDWFKFNSKEDRQFMEAELAEKDSLITVEEDEASNGYSVYLTEEGDAITFPIMSEVQISSNCSIILKKGNKLKDCNIRMFLNNQLIFDDSFSLFSHYKEFDLGPFTFQRDYNLLTIENTGGVFYIDSLIINSNVDFSSKNNNYAFQAEDSFVTGAEVSISENAMNGKYVTNNFQSSSIEFEIQSISSINTLAVLRMGYNGSYTQLSNIMDFTLNGESIPLLDVNIPSSLSLEDFLEISIGEISLSKGLNILKITSLKNIYSLDALIFTNYEITKNNHARVEAENILSSKHNGLVFSINAINNLSQKLQEGDSLSFYFHSNHRMSLNVSLVLSSMSENSLMSSESFLISLNGREVSTLDNELTYGTRLNLFSTVNFGNVNVSSGINVLSIHCLSYEFMIDSLILFW